MCFLLQEMTAVLSIHAPYLKKKRKVINILQDKTKTHQLSPTNLYSLVLKNFVEKKNCSLFSSKVSNVTLYFTSIPASFPAGAEVCGG